MSAPLLPVLSQPDAPREVLERAAGIRLACFDVDGVLTDGRLWYGADGETLKCFDVQDGLGLKLLMDAGIEVAIVSARRSAAVTARMADLGVTRVHQGIADKLACASAIAIELGIHFEEIAFIGDDLPDINAMSDVGFAIAVANARPEIHDVAHWSTRARGGRGAVREICELLLRAQAPAIDAHRDIDDGTRA